MVECNGLENRRTLTRTVGSNPTSSAIEMWPVRLSVRTPGFQPGKREFDSPTGCHNNESLSTVAQR